MSRDMEEYEEFEQRLKENYPKMFARPYGGICIDKGWWKILECLCDQIQAHTEWSNNIREARLKDNPYNSTIPDAVPQVVVAQIKEKFGGLRFYYEGGDTYIRGLVSMAEAWAANACETCGAPGKSRSGGWIKTLCDEHEAERQERMKERFKV